MMPEKMVVLLPTDNQGSGYRLKTTRHAYGSGFLVLHKHPIHSARRGEVLGFAYEEYRQLAPRLGAAQRQKMESHFELVNSLTGRLQGMRNLECSSVPVSPNQAANYEERFDQMSELIGTAFACDVTRVVSLSLGEIPTADFGYGDVTDDVHKGLAHDVFTNAMKHQAMTDYLKMHTRQVARLVDLLSSLPDTDGRSIMDNTLIVWGSELADGWHGYQHYCPVIIGGSWHFQTGSISLYATRNPH